jgi:hypothetical protein
MTEVHFCYERNARQLFWNHEPALTAAENRVREASAGTSGTKTTHLCDKRGCGDGSKRTRTRHTSATLDPKREQPHHRKRASTFPEQNFCLIKYFTVMFVTWKGIVEGRGALYFFFPPSQPNLSFNPAPHCPPLHAREQPASSRRQTPPPQAPLKAAIYHPIICAAFPMSQQAPPSVHSSTAGLPRRSRCEDRDIDALVVQAPPPPPRPPRSPTIAPSSLALLLIAPSSPPYRLYPPLPSAVRPAAY